MSSLSKIENAEEGNYGFVYSEIFLKNKHLTKTSISIIILALSVFPIWFLRQGVLSTSLFPFFMLFCRVVSGAVHSPVLSICGSRCDEVTQHRGTSASPGSVCVLWFGERAPHPSHRGLTAWGTVALFFPACRSGDSPSLWGCCPLIPPSRCLLSSLRLGLQQCLRLPPSDSWTSQCCGSRAHPLAP